LPQLEHGPAEPLRSGGRPVEPHHVLKAKEGVEMKLNVKAFSLTCAIVWSLGLFILTWWIIAIDGATGETTLIGRLYRGFNISPIGSLIGFVWAFADGLIGGAIFAWLYNLLSARFLRSES
jgi:hypothetical protein